MAFAATVIKLVNMGSKWIALGQFTQLGTDEGGAITTKLKGVEAFDIQLCSDAVSASHPVVNGTFPVSNGVVTIVTATGVKHGCWRAEGKL